MLVAEDNDINALLVTRTLEKLGHRRCASRDGRAALRHVEASLSGMEAPLDLVLLDIRMPELDGLAVARAIRAREAEIGTSDTLPLLAVTANVSARRPGRGARGRHGRLPRQAAGARRADAMAGADREPAPLDDSAAEPASQA